MTSSSYQFDWSILISNIYLYQIYCAQCLSFHFKLFFSVAASLFDLLMIHCPKGGSNKNILIGNGLVELSCFIFFTTDLCAIHIKAVQAVIYEKTDILCVCSLGIFSS